MFAFDTPHEFRVCFQLFAEIATSLRGLFGEMIRPYAIIDGSPTLVVFGGLPVLQDTDGGPNTRHHDSAGSPKTDRKTSFFSNLCPAPKKRLESLSTHCRTELSSTRVNVPGICNTTFACLLASSIMIPPIQQHAYKDRPPHTNGSHNYQQHY